MMRFIKLLTFFGISLLSVLLICCGENIPIPSDDVDDSGFTDKSSPYISEEIVPNLIIREGYISNKEETIRILRKGTPIALVKLSEPITVVQAENKEDWGYFQFPIVYRAEEDALIVEWQMKADSYTAYGKDGRGRMVSKDNGKTWSILDKEYIIKDRYRAELSDGSILQVYTPASRSVLDYSSLPSPIGETIKGFTFYRENELPDELRGVYLTFIKDGYKNNIHASLNDPGLLRYSIDGYFPVVWWGNIKELCDGSLVAGVYPAYYQNPDGTVTNSTVSFYKSNDRGYNWGKIGNIPYYEMQDGRYYSPGFYDTGYTEPAFEILKDSTFFCVMRTGYNTPMYRSYSSDKGNHWSFATPLTSNGVMPNLLLLKNGVLVMSSGRPGVQLRFNVNGDGKEWTEPIEMLPYMNNGEYDVYASCGYTSILPDNDDSFYIVYSDFKTKNTNGENRKSILFRRVQIITK